MPDILEILSSENYLSQVPQFFVPAYAGMAGRGLLAPSLLASFVISI